ncbi:MAG: peptidylprolyl isomerase [Sphaerochaeta sp.]
MKRIIVTVLAAAIAATFAIPVFSAISTPVARVNLTKTTVITQEQIDERMVAYRETYGDSVTEATVLDAMISDELIAQALARDGFVLSDDQKNELLSAQKQAIEAQLGTSLTDERFESFIQTNYGATVESFKEYLAQQYTIQNYVTAKKADMFDQSSLVPSDSTIEAFYKKNKSTFISPENVKLSHIFFNFGEDKDAALKKATDVANRIASGSITFEKAVAQYSEDKASIDSAGDIGWLTISDSNARGYMGENFFDKVFELEAGDVSSVIESLAGYHIVKVSVHNQAKFLGIDDKTSPTETTTVRDYIKNYIYNQNVSEKFQQAFLSLVNDLKSEASIKYLKK